MKDWAETMPARVSDGVSQPEPFGEALIEGRDPDLQRREGAMGEMAHAMSLPFEEDVEPGRALCQRCEIVPRVLTGPGTILVSLPHTHTLGKAMRWVRESGQTYDEADGILRIRVPEGEIGNRLAPLSAVLSATERRLTRVVYRADGSLPQPSDPFDAEDIATFAARASSGWLLDLVRDKRLTVHFQPIVECGDGKTVFAYECLLRGLSPEGLIPPGRIFSLAARADLVFQVDQAARRAALHAAAEKGIRERIFVNFTPNAIFDAAYCLDSTVRLVDELRLPREQIVFEIVESERLPEIAHLQSIVAYYRDHGFGVALDDVGAGYASLQVLLDLRPDFAKIDMTLTRDVHRDKRKATLTERLLDTAHELGSKTVLEGVEAREEWEWARDCEADLVQGYFFGRPEAEPRAPFSATDGA